MKTDRIVRWAIRHIPTGGYLPEVGPRMGYTGTEPVLMEKGAFSPRLFSAEQYAKAALTWWLKGITTRTYYRGYTDRYGDWDADEKWETFMPESDEYMTYVPRRREDFEIVEMTLTCEVSDGVHTAAD